MARRKIDYGIDLGTTNSAIARVDEGDVRILKSKDGQMDTTASCVGYNKREALFVGYKAFNMMEEELKAGLKEYQKSGNKKARNTFAEFKRNMGTSDLQHCDNTHRDYSPEELSSEVLKKVRSNVDDEAFASAVITVPAMFKQQQIVATQKAAELAGFQYCELLQEPIAASIAYGLTGKGVDGYWLVFDFGGGTFDAALMRSEEGIIKVVDTSGDNHLGGQNLDYAIVDHILIPHLQKAYSIQGLLNDPEAKFLLRDALKPAAEQIKKEFSTQIDVEFLSDYTIGNDDEDEPIELDLEISASEFEVAVFPHFQRAIDLSLEVLKRSHLKGSDLVAVLLVGGPTFLPILRRMLREQVSPKVNVSVDPMTAVAVGAAVFASTKDVPSHLVTRDLGKVQLTLKYPETTVETEEKLGIRVERALANNAVIGKLYAEVKRKDGLWTSGKVLLENDREILDLRLAEGRANGFSIRIFDEQGSALSCEPDTFSIIQGFKPPEATLPYHLCLLANHSELKKECIVPIEGLEKNVTLPAKGKLRARTQMDLHPGKDGEIRIPIYGTQTPLSRAYPAEIQDTFIISASKLPQFLPSDSPVEFRMTMDASRIITVCAYFPSFDEELIPERVDREEDMDHAEITRDLKKANKTLATLQEGPGSKTEITELKRELGQIEENLEQGQGSGDRLGAAGRLANVWKRLDDLEGANEWPKAEAELNDAHDTVLKTQDEFGSPQSAQAVTEIEPLILEVVRRKDVSSAKKLTQQLYGIHFGILRQHTMWWIYMLQHIDESYQTITWRSPGLARQILTEAKQYVAAGSPTRARVEEYVRKLWDLQPDSQESLTDELNRKLLRI